MFDLTGKSALVTGASGGIGAEIARALHGAGATVGLSGTREDPLRDLAGDLGDRAHVLPCNLSDAEAVTALPKQAVEAMGAVDILVNNAGVTRDNLFMRMSDDEWSSVIEVNLTAAFRLTKGVLRGMMKARWGRIVNVSSVYGILGSRGHAGYNASKGAVRALTKATAVSHGRSGVRANSVHPGVMPPMKSGGTTDDRMLELRERFAKSTPLGRMGTSADVANALLFLASDESSYITGAEIVVDGGLMAQ